MQTEVIDGFIISPQQEHLWLLQQVAQNSNFCVQCAISITGDLDTKVLNTALEMVVKRQEILRTVFHDIPGMMMPVQVIKNPYELSIPEYNLSSYDCQEQQTKIPTIFDEAKQQVKDWKQSQILHISLVIVSPSQHILLVSMSAMCGDAATLKNLVREISDCYAACLRGEELANEPLQYADIAEWQHELLEAEDTSTGKTYWRKQKIANFLNLQLPFDRKIRKNTDFLPEFISLKIDNEQLLKIDKIASANETSVAIVLLTCWQILLWRITKESDIIVGFACNARKYQELKETLGLLTKYLPLHCQLEDNLQFTNVLHQVKALVSEVEEWQESFTWEQIGWSDKNEALLPFCPLSFDFEEESAKYFVGDLAFSIYQQYTCTDLFEIKLSCQRWENSLIATFHYDANLFYAADIQRLAGQFQTLVASVASNSEAIISELEILQPSERQQLLIEFNNTQTDYPLNKCIQQLFEEQAQITPNSIAVVCKDQKLTYAELNARANKLAHHLQKQGVKKEVLVGICVERSLEMIVGLLAILKAGGAYVPLDPAYPIERLEFMLTDSQASVLLTQEKLVGKLSDLFALTPANSPISHPRVFCLDTDWETISQETEVNPVSSVSSDNLAYIIYTSGSTGKPKGVLVTHQNLVNSTLARLTYYLEAITNFLLLSSFAFDSSVAGIFWTLCQGGTLVLPPEGIQQELSKLLQIVAQNHISHLLSLPSLYALLLEQAQSEQLIALRTVIVAGEPCSRDLVQRHLEKLPDTYLFNEYGPTEGTVWSSVYHCQAQEQRTQIPIGCPIANTQIYILDSHLRPVPIGVVGEMYIGGLGIVRGYLHRPDLTAERFIPNPFVELPGARLYKTGDLARYLPDGKIEFLNRIDHQVKIRGFRIELGEIEAVLRQHPAVEQTVVVAREDVPGNQRLVAYLVVNSETAPSTQELQQLLNQKLPDYMVPSSLVLLEALPLTPNGKVDRRALPDPNVVQSELRAYVAPRTPVEEALASIWADVLGRKQVGIHDNFFELGGDSILSIQVIARANQAGLALAPKQLFQHQTIAQLATVAGTTQVTVAFQGLVTGQVLLTPIQKWFFEQDFQQPHHWNQAILLDVHQPLNLALLEMSVQQLLLHHDALRLQFIDSPSGLEQVHTLPNTAKSVQIVDLSTIPEKEQTTAMTTVANQLQASLNLESGLLVRVALFDFGSTQHSRLLLIVHHLLVDGVSWRILLEDLQTAYQQLSRGQAIQLPPKTTSFQDWAQRLHEYAQTTALMSELEYWLALDWSSVASLPVDYPEGVNANTETTASKVSVVLTPEETQVLLQEVPQAYNTQINDVLLVVLVQAFAQWAGMHSLLVDLEGHGREEILPAVDLSRTVGWFTSVFPVLLQLPAKITIGEALKLVKEQLRRIPNHGISFGILRYLTQDSAITEKLQALPKAEVSFNYLGQLDRVLPADAMFQPAIESTGSTRSPYAQRSYLLDVNAAVIGGSLQLDWIYSTAVHQQKTIENLAHGYLTALRVLMTYCQSSEAGGYTSSDFPAAKLSQQDIDNLIATISQTNGRN